MLSPSITDGLRKKLIEKNFFYFIILFMISKNYDLVILGAGIAGLSLANELINSGLKILLIDTKGEIDTVKYLSSGSFLNNNNLKLPEKLFYNVNKLYFYSGSNLLIKNIKARVIDRKGLLKFWYNNLLNDNNIDIQLGVNLIDLKIKKNTVKYIVFSRKSKTFKVFAKVFADCTGFNSYIGKKIGLFRQNYIPAFGIEYLLPLKNQIKKIFLFIGKGLNSGYGWIFPLNKKYAIAGFGTIDKNDFKNVRSIFSKMYENWHLSKICKFKPSNITFATLKTGYPVKSLTKGNVLLIGDSALQANPLIGEGIRFIIDAAGMAAKWIKIAISNNNIKILHNYSKQWRQKYYKMYKNAFFIQRFLYYACKNDKICDKGISVLKCASNNEIEQIIGGNISFCLLFKLFLKALWKYKIKKFIAK